MDKSYRSRFRLYTFLVIVLFALICALFLRNDQTKTKYRFVIDLDHAPKYCYDMSVISNIHSYDPSKLCQKFHESALAVHISEFLKVSDYVEYYRFISSKTYNVSGENILILDVGFVSQTTTDTVQDYLEVIKGKMRSITNSFAPPDMILRSPMRDNFLTVYEQQSSKNIFSRIRLVILFLGVGMVGLFLDKFLNKQ